MAKRKAVLTSTPRISRIQVHDILERVTRAEERVISLNKDTMEWRTEQRLAHENVSARLGAIETSLTKYQGAWGAITLILSAIVTAAAIFSQAIMKKLGWD
jgi:hypothetical protein